MASPSSPELRRELGFFDLTLFAIACIVGPRWIAVAAGAGPGSVLLWIAAAITFAAPLGVAVAALIAKYPEAGGLYVWARRLRTLAWLPLLLGLLVRHCAHPPQFSDVRHERQRLYPPDPNTPISPTTRPML